MHFLSVRWLIVEKCTHRCAWLHMCNEMTFLISGYFLSFVWGCDSLKRACATLLQSVIQLRDVSIALSNEMFVRLNGISKLALVVDMSVNYCLFLCLDWSPLEGDLFFSYSTIINCYI